MTDPPIFIVGFQRSGTTLLRLMLDSHPDIAIPLDTTGLWDRYEHRLPSYGDLAAEAGRRRLVADLLAEDRIRLWGTALTADQVLRRWTQPGYPGLIRAFYECYADLHRKRRWGDKDPGNMTRIEQLNRWFPDARFIHIIRDGRDACLSQTEQDFGFDNILECAGAWREEVQWVRRMGGLLAGRYVELRYEDLVTGPEAVLQRLCRFLGISYDQSMLQYHQRVDSAIPAEKRHIWPLIDKPPQSDHAGRWKSRLSHGERVCFEKRAGAVLRDLEYEALPRASGAYWSELRSLVGTAWLAVRRRLGLAKK
jgi:hypothetical protein